MTDVDPASAAMIQLPAILDLNAAGPLAHELGGMRGRGVQVDASAVRRLGAQCLQVLMSAQQTWANDGHVLKIGDASREFTDQWNAFGAAPADHPLGALS